MMQHLIRRSSALRGRGTKISREAVFPKEARHTLGLVGLAASTSTSEQDRSGIDTGCHDSLMLRKNGNESDDLVGRGRARVFSSRYAAPQDPVVQILQQEKRFGGHPGPG